MRRVPLFVASGNPKKLHELMDLLYDLPVDLKNSFEFPGLPNVIETGATFAENAALKAISASLYTGILALADDSGLEVDALDGAPGVHSARYASSGTENASDEANRRKLIVALRNVTNDRRTARFRCSIAVASEGKVILTADGAVEGVLLSDERGDGGFGYDPLFVPLGGSRTFAEMTNVEKSQISHRSRALAALKLKLIQYVQQNY